VERRILSLRIVSFAVAVARVHDPSLAGRPVVVAAGTGPRSIVLAASDEARGDGVRRGLVLPEALKRCRGAIVLNPDPDLYARATACLTSILDRYAPAVEPEAGGRLFADLTGTRRLFGDAVDVAARVQREIRERLRLPANAGVAVNKLVSGVAARVVRPVGLADVVPGGEERFLRPVAVGHLPAVDRGVEGKLLEDLNVARVGQLTAIPLARLEMVFGRAGDLLYRQARGQDDTPVRPPSRAAIIEETTQALPPGMFPEDTSDDPALLAALHALVERSCRRLRRMGGLAGEAGLSIRYSDGAAAARRVALRPPLDLDLSLFARLREIFPDVVARRGRVRSMTLRLARIGPVPAQMSLFAEGYDAPRRPDPALAPARERSLMKALDRIRARYDESAVVSGRAPLPAVPPAA